MMTNGEPVPEAPVYENRIRNIEQRLDAMEKRQFRCGFCGKTRDQVKITLVGPITVICNECVAACCKSLADHMGSDFFPVATSDAPKPRDPIYQEKDTWYFLDETDQPCGPYDSRADAEKELRAYCASLNDGSERKPVSPFQMWLDSWCFKNLDCNLCAITGDTCAVAGSTIRKLLDAIENFITVPNANGDLFTSSPTPASADSEWCKDCKATHPKQAPEKCVTYHQSAGTDCAKLPFRSEK